MPTEPAHVDPDLVNRMRVYRVATALLEQAWGDAELLAYNPVTATVASQLYTAIASIAANIAEGYSRSSGRDRARIFEYALGSARESIVWYSAAAKVLPAETLRARRDSLDEIKRILLAVIPRERVRLVRPARPKA